ncbi:hypothetical protein HC891_05645 [Candidatus Gracilibacteria bacterium]|nr:hypothetical protein [Candidatus Gracilibacteria bacterium]
MVISLTFPDGRVLSPVVTSIVDTNSLQNPAFTINGVPINGLDGVIDMPINFPFVRLTDDSSGDFAAPFPITNRWPYGCYSFTALGLASNRQISTDFAVAPLIGPAPNPGTAVLTVEDNTTGDPSSQQGAIVNIFGRGFFADEDISVWITAPDGTVFPFAYLPRTSNVGAFAAPFVFNANHPTGFYGFTALGQRSGFQVITRFNLTSRPSVASGYAQLQVSTFLPNPGSNPQNSIFQVKGKLFQPYDRVDLWLTLPDGAVRGLPSQFTDEYGQFYAEIYLDERLPTGVYDVSAVDQHGNLTFTTFTLEAGSPNVPANPLIDPAPQVVDSNSAPALPETTGPGPQYVEPFIDAVDPVF